MKRDFPHEASYRDTARILGCDIAAVKAVATVEAGAEGAFYPTGEPVILFERHVFHRLTDGRFDTVAPGLSNPKPGGYGPSSTQHARLDAAVKLERCAALESASWGLFQIMGYNWEAAGFRGDHLQPDGVPLGLQRFINAMYRSADEHLKAFGMFIRSSPAMLDAIRLHDWETLAYLYNGRDFAKNAWDKKIAEAFRQEQNA